MPAPKPVNPVRQASARAALARRYGDPERIFKAQQQLNYVRVRHAITLTNEDTVAPLSMEQRERLAKLILNGPKQPTGMDLI